MADYYKITGDELDEFHSRFVPVAFKIIGNLDKAKDDTEYISRRIVVALSVVAREIEKAIREYESSKGVKLEDWRPHRSDAFNIVCSAFHARLQGSRDVPHWNSEGGYMLAGFAAGITAAKMAESAFDMMICADNVEQCVDGADIIAQKAGELDARDNQLNAELKKKKDE